jgi:FG-GAP-like repeat
MKHRISILIAIITSIGCGSSQKQQQKFEVKTIAVGKGPGSVEVSDFNHDQLPDIAVANSQDSSVSILLNQGHRIFLPAAGSPFYAGHFPNDINIADFNEDGNPDLAFANHERKYLTLFLGNGKGQFSAAPHSPFPVQVKPHTHGVISADFNGDGHLDLATDSWGVDSIVVLYGNGAGDFSNPTYFATGKHPYQRLRTADLNGDHKPDIVTTNLDGNSVTILLGDGKGGFSSRLFNAGNTPFGVAIGDVNGDGIPDLAVLNSPTISGGKPGEDGLTILLGDGQGHFSMCKGSPFKTGLGPTRVAIGDLNGDGINDIVLTNYNSNFISIYYMGKAGLLSATTIPSGRADGVAIHDMDGDGKNDIIISSYTDNCVYILFNK